MAIRKYLLCFLIIQQSFNISFLENLNSGDIINISTTCLFSTLYIIKNSQCNKDRNILKNPDKTKE
jgi:hypothetical protein